MRYLVVATTLLFAAPAEAQQARVMTHAETMAVFQGSQACHAPNEEGACASVAVIEQADDQSIRLRTVGLTQLQGLADQPLSEVARGLAMYEAYAELFTALEAERVSLGALYLKQSEALTAVYDPQARAYCGQVDVRTSMRETEFYFSSNTSTSTDGDHRLSDESAERLRSFFVALVADAEFRTAMPPDPELTLLLDLMAGTRPLCTVYAGGELNNELVIVGVVAFSGDVPVNSLTEAIVMRPATLALRLIPE